MERAGRFESFLLGTSVYHSSRASGYQQVLLILHEYYWLIPFAVLAIAIVIGRMVHAQMERIAARRLA